MLLILVAGGKHACFRHYEGETKRIKLKNGNSKAPIPHETLKFKNGILKKVIPFAFAYERKVVVKFDAEFGCVK